MQENRCICCGAVIPEGMQVCPECRTEQEDEVPEYSFIVLQKEGQEERKEMPIILSFLIAAGKYMLADRTGVDGAGKTLLRRSAATDR